MRDRERESGRRSSARPSSPPRTFLSAAEARVHARLIDLLLLNAVGGAVPRPVTFPSAFETPACARFDGISSVGSVGSDGAVIDWGLPKRELAVLRPMTSFPAAQTRISIGVRTTTSPTSPTSPATTTTSPTTGTSATLACQVPILATLETLRIPPRVRAPTLHQTLPPILRPPDPTLTHRLDQRITPLQPRHPDLGRHHLRTHLRHRSDRRPRRRPLGHRNSRRDRHRPRLQRRRRRCSTGTMVLLRRHRCL